MIIKTYFIKHHNTIYHVHKDKYFELLSVFSENGNFPDITVTDNIISRWPLDFDFDVARAREEACLELAQKNPR
jgi:hypothetical protein